MSGWEVERAALRDCFLFFVVLPIILSIPHASTRVPEELEGRVLLSERDLLSYSDLFTDRIFHMENARVVAADVARIFVDVNRAPDDISREYTMNEEGVIVHMTWDGKPIYTQEPTEEEIVLLLRKYHDRFHEEIDAHIPSARFLIDCHSFLPVGPPLKIDAGKPRPDICLGNSNYSTCTRQHTVFFRDFFERHGFTVSINFPYQGKYTLGRHCHRRRIPHFLVPGLQIELNQKLYADVQTLHPDDGKIADIHHLFCKAVSEFTTEFFPQ